MQTVAVIAAALLSLAATSSWAQTDTGKSQTISSPTAVSGVKVTASKDDPDAIVCIHHDPTNSRIPGPAECHPRRVWNQISDAGRQALQDVQQRSQFINR